MALLRDRRIVADPWARVADDAALPDRPAIVSLARLKADACALRARNQPVGVALPNDANPDALGDALAWLAMVVLRFPKHRDGRAFTQARTLRERHAFTGEIRATGHVLPDQYAFLLRCGFTSVEVPDTFDPAVWERALGAIPTAYQAAIVGDRPLAQLRRRVVLG